MKSNIIILLVALSCCAGAYWMVQPPKATALSVASDASLSKENMKWVTLFKLESFLKAKYNNDVNVKTKDDEVIIDLKNQGKQLSQFYNNNDALLKDNDMDFSIDANKNDGSLQARFEIDEKEPAKTIYAYVPIDVLIGILNNK